jgi:predicted kinase
MEDRVLILMRGIPGSGKSTVAEAIATRIGAVVFSTDEYWYQRGERRGRPGFYDFDFEELGMAHQWNQSRAKNLMKFGKNVVIDNTNIDERAMKPYRDLAKTYGYSVSVVYVNTDVETCIARQADRSEERRVPEDVIRAMAAKLERK